MKKISNKKNFNFQCYKLLISLFVVFFIYGCSSDSTKDISTTTENQQVVIDTTFTHKELLTVKDTIEAALSNAMERLRYYDNSGLYENEFAYLTDETSFDEYLKFGQITYHPPGDVISLELDSLVMFAHDSALTWISISLEFKDGKVEKMTEQSLIVYYHNNKWIKPTVSVIKNQVAYDDLIRQAEEASQWEDE